MAVSLVHFTVMPAASSQPKICPTYTIDALPPAGMATCYHAIADGHQYTLVMRHHGLHPGPATVHILNDKVHLSAVPAADCGHRQRKGAAW